MKKKIKKELKKRWKKAKRTIEKDTFIKILIEDVFTDVSFVIKNLIKVIRIVDSEVSEMIETHYYESKSNI